MKLRRTKIVAFKTLDISQGSVATHLRCGGLYSYTAAEHRTFCATLIFT